MFSKYVPWQRNASNVFQKTKQPKLLWKTPVSSLLKHVGGDVAGIQVWLPADNYPATLICGVTKSFGSHSSSTSLITFRISVFTLVNFSYIFQLKAYQDCQYTFSSTHPSHLSVTLMNTSGLSWSVKPKDSKKPNIISFYQNTVTPLTSNTIPSLGMVCYLAWRRPTVKNAWHWGTFWAN